MVRSKMKMFEKAKSESVMQHFKVSVTIRRLNAKEE
jgi:hypothetical protein